MDTESFGDADEDSSHDALLSNFHLKFQRLARGCGVAACILTDERWRSDFTVGLMRWCREYSWVTCSRCKKTEPAPMTPARFNAAVNGPATKKHRTHVCKGCSTKSGHPAPRLEDIPEPLRNMDPLVRRILSPLYITVPYERRKWGYRVRKGPVRFSWKQEAFDSRKHSLPSSLQAIASEAYAFLMASSSSTFRFWTEQHVAFLQKGDTSRKARRLPLKTLQAAGIECSVWPDLYPFSKWCPTLWRESERKRSCQEAPSDDDVSDCEDGSKARSSILSAFAAQVFSEIPGFSTEYNLMQFVYDSWLYSTVTGASATGPNVRAALAGKNVSPLYWLWQHLKAIDLQRQLSWPTFFYTKAPYEWSFPWSTHIADVRLRLGKPITGLSSLETVHIAHTLTQLFTGCLAGGNSGKDWRTHLFRNKHDPSVANVLAFMWRIEFQDGTRKHATQSYHGRGTPHLHALKLACLWHTSLRCVSYCTCP